MDNTLQLLNQISDELNKDLNLKRILQRVIDLTISYFEASSGSIMIFDSQHRVTDYILQRKGVSDDNAQKIVGRVLTNGFAGWVLRHGKGDIITDTRYDNRWYTFPNQPYTVRSVVSTPLTRRNRVIGILTINHDSQPHHFSAQDLALATAIAGQAAIAIENARLFRQTERERTTLSAIINSTQDALLVTKGDDHRVILLNPAAESLLKIEPGAWRNTPLSELVDKPELFNFLASNMTETELKFGEDRTMFTSMMDVPNIGRLTLMHDISALKALDKMKSEYITTFTHDLAAPLAAIKGHLNLLEIDGPLTERQHDDIDVIGMSVDQMRTLIKDLLELTRLESLKNLYTRPIDLNEFVRKTQRNFQSVAGSKKITLSLRSEAPDITAEGNPTLISRAIDNLVENAIKYTKADGNVELIVSVNGKEAYISVRDDGIGIPDQSIPQVFNRFFRAHAANDNETPGSGLGLSIVKTIVERHGGRVWVDSHVNQGSTFTIALPTLKPEASALPA